MAFVVNPPFANSMIVLLGGELVLMLGFVKLSMSE